jgi:hypothetical protein
MRSRCGLAHEAELRQALSDLSREFDRWKASRIDSFELADRIHKFHHGPNTTVSKTASATKWAASKLLEQKSGESDPECSD